MDWNDDFFPANGDSSEVHQREVNVLNFVKDRVNQIAELLEAVDNATLITGEVTKGPRTALQRLPRHMRRRAMSYNVKRLPRSQRRFALPLTRVSKHRKKPPSRFWRRRPRNLLKAYIRRQRKSVWLETHIWHAKRFRMIEKYGYKIAMRSFQRAFRPSYRDSVRHCIVQDISFLRCFQITVEDKQTLISALRALFAPSTGPTLAFKTSLAGKFEISTFLYEPNKYPRGFIGPVRFMWCGKEGSSHHLVFWSHPSTAELILKHLITLLDLSKPPVKTGTVRNLRNEGALYEDTYVSNSQNCRVLDLREQFTRFRLYGPQSLAILEKVLMAVNDDETHAEWMKTFKTHNDFWRDEICGRTFGEFPNGLVLYLLVSDPRLSKPSRKQKPSGNHRNHRMPFNVEGVPSTSSEFWNAETRKLVLESRVSEEELQKRRRDNLACETLSCSKIPVLLVTRNLGSGTTRTFTGVDMVVPIGFAMDFWLALQYGTARAVGMSDQKSIEFESDLFHFPCDAPDCEAGSKELKEERKLLKEKYFAKPHNRRVQYWSTLSVKYPFTFAWPVLIRSWINASDRDNVEFKNIYVLRDRACLIILDRWLRGRCAEPTAILESHPLSLIPVRIDATRRGRPRRYAIICIPIEEDLQPTNKSKDRIVRTIEEPRRVSEVKKSTLHNNEVLVKTNEIKGFIELAESKKEKFVSLNVLFPDKQLFRKRKKVALRKQKRQKAKVAKRKKHERESTEKTVKIEVPDQVPPTNSCTAVENEYKESCSRLIVGRVVRGDYSFCAAKGRGIGYCSLLALKKVQNGRILFRNTTSKYYHFGKISVLKDHMFL